MVRCTGNFGDVPDMPTPSNTPVGDSDMEDEGEESSDDEPGTSYSSRYPRPTIKNPFNGLVEGVKRGNIGISK